MHKSPLLSICIPTYNRAHYLIRSLESIVTQIQDTQDIKDAVEVVISDNCSTDNTKEIVEKFLNRGINIKYLRNKEDVGFDLNIYNVVSNASSTYCWYLGDDDVITNGGIAKVVDLLKNGEFDFVGVNAEHLIDDSYKKPIGEKPLVIITDNDFNDFYFGGYCQGGVSVLIFNRETWMNQVKINDYLRHWLYYETILRLLVATKKPMAFIKDTLIYTGQDCRWAEGGEELYTFGNSNLLLERMLGFGFDKIRIEGTLKENRRKSIIILLRAKGHDLKCNYKNFQYMYTNFKVAGLLTILSMMFIYFIPNSLIKWVRDIRKSKINSTNLNK